MKTMNIARRELRAIFFRRGYTLKAFAEERGFNYQTVKRTIQRHWGQKTRPWGDTTVEILDALERYIHDETPSISGVLPEEVCLSKLGGEHAGKSINGEGQKFVEIASRKVSNG